MLRQRALAQTGQSDFHAALRLAVARLPALVAAMLLSCIAVVLGTMLLMLPGMYLGVCLLCSAGGAVRHGESLARAAAQRAAGAPAVVEVLRQRPDRARW